MLCSRNSPVAKKFVDNKRKSIKIFCLTMPNNSVKDPSVFHKNSRIECFYGWMQCHDFPPKKFQLTMPETFKGHTYSVSLISGLERS